MDAHVLCQGTLAAGVEGAHVALEFLRAIVRLEVRGQRCLGASVVIAVIALVRLLSRVRSDVLLKTALDGRLVTGGGGGGEEEDGFWHVVSGDGEV